jgi:hypothetical protein
MWNSKEESLSDIKFLSVPRHRTYLWATIFLTGFSLRCLLIFKFPSLYAWDAFTRIWDSDYIIVRRWLPLPQLPIFMAHYFDLGLLFVRLTYALIGALGAITFGIGISRILGVFQGMGVALLTTFLGTYFKYSLVPYQEGMFLLFVGLYLTFGPFNRDEINDQKNWLGSLYLSLACLCRYEAWLFLTVIASGMLIRKKWQVIKSMIPIFFVPLAWLLIYKHIPAGNGPPWLEREAFSLGFHLFSNLTELSKLVWNGYFTICLRILFEITLIGIVLQCSGMYTALKKNSGIIGREFLLFWFLLSGLALARWINSHSLLTDRMLLLLNVIGTVYIAVGLEALILFLKMKSNRKVESHQILMTCLFSLMLLLFIFRSVYAVSNEAKVFYPEYAASHLLKQVPEDKTVLLQPRNVPNMWKEDAITAIFANVFGELDHREKRFIFSIKQAEEQPDYYLKWTGERYQLFEQNEPEFEM